MAEKKEKKKKEKTNVVLPKAWQSVKHRNETAQAKANYDDLWKTVGVILMILFVVFVATGGISQTGFLRAVFNWSTNVGNSLSDWLSGGSVVVNEDGIYIDPTGQNGMKINDDNAPEVINPNDTFNELIDIVTNPEGGATTGGENTDGENTTPEDDTSQDTNNTTE